MLTPEATEILKALEDLYNAFAETIYYEYSTDPERNEDLVKAKTIINKYKGE